MKLLRLHLKNFRQHVDSEIAFDAGLTAIVGSNGAGKTTLIESIGFALYGSKAIRGKIEDLCSMQSATGVVTVELTFEIEGLVYRVIRTQSGAELYVGGENAPLVEGNREVVNRVSQIVGMSYEEFLATFLTEQKGLEFLSGKKGATEREKFIIRMMGYDSLEKVQELLREDRKDRRSTVTGWEAGLGAREELENRKKEEGAKKLRLDAIYEEKIAQLEKLQKDADEAKSIFDKNEALFTKWSSRKNTLRDLEIKYTDRTERIKLIQKKASALLETPFEGKTLKDLVKNTSWHEILEGARAREQEIRKVYQTQTATLHEEELSARTYISSLHERKELMAKDMKRLQDRSKQISSLNTEAPCPTCGQELGSAVKTVIKSAKGDLEELTRALKDLEAQIVDAQKTPKLSELKEAQSKQARLLAEEEARIARLESIRQQALQADQYEKDLAALREEITVLDGELASGKKELTELRFSEDEYRGIKAKYDAATKMVDIARLQKVETEGDLKMQSALYEKASADLTRFEERAVLLEQYKRELVTLEEGDRILTDFRKALNDGIKPQLAEIAGDFLSELTDGLYTSVQIGSDFAPYISESGEVKSVISGGETDILHLCVRLALSQMIAERAGHPLSLLILDEVFGSLDEQRRSNVLHLLERLSNRFEQIIVITHMDDIKESVENLIYVRYDEELNRSVTQKQVLSSEYHF